jgi:flavoprotein
MQSPCNKKEVQKLAGMMVALSRFVSKSGERGMRFYKLLKKHDDFLWSEQVEEAF